MNYLYSKSEIPAEAIKLIEVIITLVRTPQTNISKEILWQIFIYYLGYYICFYTYFS